MSYNGDLANLSRENGRYGNLPQVKPNSPAGTHQGPIDRTSKLYKSAQDFESIFIKQMLNAMKKTVDKSDSLVQKNQGEDIFEDMLYDEYSKTMSKTAGFGLADTLYRQLAYIEDVQKK